MTLIRVGQVRKRSPLRRSAVWLSCAPSKARTHARPPSAATVSAWATQPPAAYRRLAWGTPDDHLPETPDAKPAQPISTEGSMRSGESCSGAAQWTSPHTGKDAPCPSECRAAQQAACLRQEADERHTQHQPAARPGDSPAASPGAAPVPHSRQRLIHAGKGEPPPLPAVCCPGRHG